jgi:hypothetical protein
MCRFTDDSRMLYFFDLLYVGVNCMITNHQSGVLHSGGIWSLSLGRGWASGELGMNEGDLIAFVVPLCGREC